MSNPSTYKEYNKYKNGKGASTPFAFLWAMSLAAGFVTLNSDNNVSGKFFACSFVPLFIGVHINNQHCKHLRKAISIYNSQL